jgi:NTE family protein
MPLAGPKKALVLSAGGAFAAYQAGAWEILSARFSPDIVVGASAGSLNAWAVAGGATPSELTELWLDPACAELAVVRGARLPWHGVFDPAPLHARIEALWKAYRPRVEIGIVALELRSLRPRLFRNEEITWRHLAASCAVPFGYQPIRLGGRLYVDGGLLESLPLWAASEMGAGRIVAIDVFDRAPASPLRVLTRACRSLLPRPPRRRDGTETRLIVPSENLGSSRKAVFWDPSAVRRWIALGRADAARAAEP